jgi:hypothetical protein
MGLRQWAALPGSSGFGAGEQTGLEARAGRTARRVARERKVGRMATAPGAAAGVRGAAQPCFEGAVAWPEEAGAVWEVGAGAGAA